MAIPRIVPYLVGDLDAVKRFYTVVLGLEVAMDGADFLGFRSPDNPSAQLVASAPGVEEPVPSLGIDVGDPEAVDAAHAAVLAQGLEVVYPRTDEPWGIYRFFVRDPTGAVISVLAHRA